MNNKLKELKQQMQNIQKEIEPLKKQENRINKEYITLLKEYCKKNIGKCFKVEKGETITYCKIINIDTLYTTTQNHIHFNPYQYSAVCFDYQDELHNFKNSTIPFSITTIYISEYGEKIFKEIPSKEYIEKFLEVNDKWSKKVIEI